jgi:nucleoside-diphosphate-sugar epimerase
VLDLHRPEPTLAARVDVHVGDVRDAAAVDAALAGCDAVVHLAAAHHDFGISEATYFGVNEGGLRVLCAGMARHGITRILFTSSCAVYGTAPEPHDERCTPAPDSPYGASKLAGERVLEEWVRGDSARRALVIRPTVTFGPGNFANMYTLIRQIARGQYWPVGEGANLKSMSYVENLVAASLFLWARTDAPAFDVFNWVEKPDLSSDAIARAVYAGLGRSYPRTPIPLGLALALALPFDAVASLTGINLPVTGARIRKLAGSRTVFEARKVRDAGFTPSVSLADGITRMVQWYVREGHALPIVRHLPPERAVDPT